MFLQGLDMLLRHTAQALLIGAGVFFKVRQRFYRTSPDS